MARTPFGGARSCHGIGRMEMCGSVERLNAIRGCEDREAISELGLRIVFGLRDAGGEPVMRSRRGDQEGRALTSAGRGRRQDVGAFNVTIRVQRYARRV